MNLKLYYSPGACSLVPHIALEESGAPFEPVQVFLAQGEHKLPEYLAINPHARVPALEVDDHVVTENVAILNFIADVFGSPGSVPTDAPDQRARCNQLLGWFASTVHISFAQIWRAERFSKDASVHSAIQCGGRDALLGHFVEIDGLCGEGWLVKDQFSGADSYLLTFFRWARRVEFDMSLYPRWSALVDQVLGRPGVQRAIESEGLEAGEFRLG